MNKILVGRSAEKRVMLEALLSNEPEMLAVVGRRRVGKTYLIQQVYKDRIIFEATGVQNAPIKEQLQNFAFHLNLVFYKGKAKLRPKNWLEAFQMLILALEAQQYSEKKVIFLDELPWFDAHKSGFVRALGYFWNSWCVHKDIVVVICGSAASWMIEHIVNDRGGLHNRITRKIDLAPFTLAETEQYLHSRGANLDRYQILLVYMVLGGIPHYLKEIKGGQTAVVQIGRICSPPSALANEFDNLYPALFDNASNHIAVIRALSQNRKGMTRKEIISITKRSDGGGFTKTLDELRFSGFISAYLPFGKTKKELLYRLTDEYSLFYLRFLENNIGHDPIWWQTFSQTAAFRTWCGYAFENICLKHLSQIKNALGIAGVYAAASAFSAKATTENGGFQIDLVLDRNDGAIHLFEFKFYNKALILTKADADALRIRVEAFRIATSSPKQIFLSFLSTYGIQMNETATGLVDQNLTMDILFAST